MATLKDIKPHPGSVKKKKREGRGNSGYGGKTAGKGMNGQKARKSPDINKQFEGGQTPLYRRLPKRQYISLPNRKFFSIINLKDLEVFEDGAEVTPEILEEKRIIRKLAKDGVKILGQGELKVTLKVQAHHFSVSAKEKIESAGGSCQVIGE